MSSSLFLPISIVQRLAVSLEFYDVFTNVPVRSALDVSVPTLRWQAFRSTSDATYRLLVSNREVPSGTFDVSVVSVNGLYLSYEPVRITLKRSVAHPPPVVRNDYLERFPLWPTRLRPLPPGETAVVGRVRSAAGNPVKGLKVFMYTPPESPNGPYAFVDDAGDFVFRFPDLRMTMSGPEVGPKRATLSATVMDTIGTALASRADIVINFGTVQVVELVIP